MAGIDFGPVEAAIRSAASGSAPPADVVPQLLKSLVQTTRAVNNFPTDEQGNVALFSSNKDFDRKSSEYAKAVLSLLSSLIDQVGGKHGTPVKRHSTDLHRADQTRGWSSNHSRCRSGPN